MQPKIYDNDNYIDPKFKPNNYPANKSSAWHPFYSSSQPIKSSWFVSNRLPIQGEAVTILSSQSLKDELLAMVGACEFITNDATVGYYRDELDSELVDDIKNDDQSSKMSTNQYENAVNQLIPTLPSEVRPNNFYQSSPHIPEVWKSANMPSGATYNDVAPSGYTWLEEYANMIDN